MKHILNEKKNGPLNAKRAVYLTFKGFYRMQNLFWFTDLDKVWPSCMGQAMATIQYH